MSGPVHNHDHSFCPGFGQIGGKRPHCKPILGALLSWVIQDTTWPPKPSAFLDVVARWPGVGAASAWPRRWWSWAKETPGWNLPTPAFRRCVWLSGLRPWLPGSFRIPDSGQAFPMLQPCILGRQTLLVLVLPCPWERPSRASPALVQVQVPPLIFQPGRRTGRPSPGPEGQRRPGRTVHRP